MLCCARLFLAPIKFGNSINDEQCAQELSTYLSEMAQSTGNAQLKEHVALIEALRHKYADGEDAQSVAAIEALLSEASRASESVDETAKDIIQSRCSVGETLLLFLLILLYSAPTGWVWGGQSL